jgi:ABC-type sulfate/molybdate transport systems ATPase subunit
MPEQPQLSFQVRHHRGSFQLDLAFTVDRWPALLFGPSGAGKSTVLRILAGLEVPDFARVSLGDQVLIDSEKGIRQKPGSNGVQMVAQRPALFPHLTVRQNVTFGLRAHRHDEHRNQRVEKLLDTFGLAAFADRSPRMLSGGERQRVALARALAPRPKLLLLDEAFVGMDVARKQQLLDALPTLLEDDVPVLHVSHDVADAFLLNLHVLKVEDGRLVGQGNPAKALANEKTLLLASLVRGSDR